jgi:hypothetical protein
MQRRVSDRLILVALAVAAVSSLALKAAAGPPHDGRMDVSAQDFRQDVAGVLRAQGFAIASPPFRHRPLIRATRGECRIGVGDARQGAALETSFERDATDIGTVRYVYRGRSSDQPPAFAMRLGRIQTEMLGRLGMSRAAPMPVAIAASPECGSSDFGLADLRI